MSKFLSGFFETKSTEKQATSHAVAASPSARSGMFSGGGAWDTDKAVQDGFEKVMMVWRCIDAIATNQSHLPMFLRKGDSKKGTILQSPDFNRLFNVRPNNYETAEQFRYRLTAQALLSRRGVFVECQPNVQNPETIHLLPPSMVEPIPDPNTFVKGYKVKGADFSETELKPDQVIWIKVKPHPIDPYMQMTPLVTAGLAADTDWLARMFNRNFLANDGRPGLMVAVRGTLNPVDAEELKRRFSGGPAIAGTTTVVEADGLDVIDMGSTPRDAQWLEAIRGSQEDIRIAFGVPESVLGNASGRTFDNADAEYELFWTHTMVPHCEALAGGFDVLTGNLQDDVVVAFDYRDVDVLQRQERRKREAAIQEYLDGVITWNELRKRIGEDEWPDVMAANLVIGPGGFAMVKDKSQLAEIMKQPNVSQLAAPAGAGPGGALKPLPGRGGIGNAMSEISRAGARRGAAEGLRSLENSLSARALQLAGKAALQVRANAAPEFKEDIVDAVLVHPYADVRARLEAKIEGVMESWDSRQESVCSERLTHTKVRKGTRHWEGAEEKALRGLDPYYVVEVDRWAREMRADFEKMLRPVLAREARRVAVDIEDSGLLPTLHNEGVGNPGGKNVMERLIGAKADINARIDTPLQQVLDIVEASTRNQSNRLAAKIKDMDDAGLSIKQIQAEVRKMVGNRSDWRRGLATHVTTSAIEGIKSEMYSLGGKHIRKTWNTEEDERVRDSHVFAEGQVKQAHEPFEVGSTAMMYPGDPLAPIEETANCRCWLDWTIKQ